MSEEFIRTTVNGDEYIVMAHVTESADKSKTMNFTTDIDGKEHSLMVTLTSDAVVALQEVSGIDVQAEMMGIMEVELEAEIQRIVDKPV
jgi:hypothetical protein